MSQRKEKYDKFGHPDAFLSLLTLLETCNPDTNDTVKNMIQEHLSCSKDAKLLNNLVNFYVSTNSKKCFEIILHLKDPHDKHVFEKINEMMKNESSRYEALQLLGNIVYRQPTWLYKISDQRLMSTLLEMLKTDINSPNLLSALLILICLLPIIPHQLGTLLQDIFYIFSRLVSWNIKKPSSLSDVLNLHLQTGVYFLFHRLYGMFPCNFLAYLRSFYGGKDSYEDNGKIFSRVVKPMLERVRLHPLLVTASKDTELDVNRWKKMAYHDIIVECASVSLDTVECTLGNLQKLCCPNSIHSNKVSSYGSESLSPQENINLTLDAGSVIQENALSSENWSPLYSCSTAPLPLSSTELHSPTALRGEWEFKNIVQSSTEENITLDFAVEAKPECSKEELTNKSLPKGFADSAEIYFEDEQINKCLVDKQNISQSSFDSVNVSTKVKAVLSNDTHEEEFDKEVCDLTSCHALEQSFTSEEERHDTPFCSTTQNLTDEPINLAQSIISENYDSLTANEISDFNMQEPDLSSCITNFNCHQYFNNYRHVVDFSPAVVSRQKRIRSISCPSFSPSELLDSSLRNDSVFKPVFKCRTNFNETTASALNSRTLKRGVPIYQKLLPTVINPLQRVEQTVISGSTSNPRQPQTSKYLSPLELLDLYIQQSSTAYLSHLPLTAKTDTNWTHFGGKPPLDEIEILKNQVLLLHNLLLFERHRKDIHSERNRRILGRAKRIRMQEEHINALKSDISTLKGENEALRKELSNQCTMNQELKFHIKQIKEELDAKIFKSSQDNTQLLFSNKQIQTLLVSQKEDNDEIRDLYKKAEKEIAGYKCQLNYAKQDLQNCQKVKKEATFLSKQVIILQELNAQFKRKLEQMKKAPPGVETQLMMDAIHAELRDLKKKFEMQSIVLDSSKGRIGELESILSNERLKEEAIKAKYEEMKNWHEAEIKAWEDRLSDMQKVTLEKDAYILKLYAETEELKRNNEKHQESTNSSSCFDNGLQSFGQASGFDNSNSERNLKS